MIYGYDRCGTTALMHCLGKNRLMLGEFLYEEWCNHHFVESIVPMTKLIKQFKISNVSALNVIMESHTVIAKCHLHWVKPEYFDFKGTKILIHRQDMVEAQLSRQLAWHTKVWNSYNIPQNIEPTVLSVDDFVVGMEQRVDTRYSDQHMDYVIDYDHHLPILVKRTGYHLLPNSNKKIYDNKHELILNYDELMQKAEQFEDDINAKNATIKYTGFDSNLEYEKWTASDNVDFYH
jgi:hypothetical protein